MLRRSTMLASRAGFTCWLHGSRRALYIPGGGADPDRNNFSMKWVGLTGILAAVMLANSLDRKQEQEDELAESLGRALPDGAERVLPDGNILMADGSIRR